MFRTMNAIHPRPRKRRKMGLVAGTRRLWPTQLGYWLIGCALFSGCMGSQLGLDTRPAVGTPASDASLSDVPVYGNLVTLHCRLSRGGEIVSGELLAVEVDAVWLRDRRYVVRIARHCVRRLWLERHRSLAPTTAAWTVIGLASAIGHGALAALTGPTWIVAGTAATAHHAASNDAVVLPHQLDRLRPFARFPAGRPPRYFPARPHRPRTIQYYGGLTR